MYVHIQFHLLQCIDQCNNTTDDYKEHNDEDSDYQEHNDEQDSLIPLGQYHHKMICYKHLQDIEEILE